VHFKNWNISLCFDVSRRLKCIKQECSENIRLLHLLGYFERPGMVSFSPPSRREGPLRLSPECPMACL
jgi:hypothetical protein